MAGCGFLPQFPPDVFSRESIRICPELLRAVRREPLSGRNTPSRGHLCTDPYAPPYLAVCGIPGHFHHRSRTPAGSREFEQNHSDVRLRDVYHHLEVSGADEKRDEWTGGREAKIKVFGRSGQSMKAGSMVPLPIRRRET